MKFDNLLAEVNGFGKYQMRTVLLMVIARLTLPFHFLLNAFITLVPPHHCNTSGLDGGDIFTNLTNSERLAVSIPAQEDGALSSCQMFPQPQYQLLLNASNLTGAPTVPCRDGWVYNYTSEFKSTLASEWDLVCEDRGVNKASATIFFVGVTIGAAVFGYLSDRFGRKTVLLLAYVVTSFFGFASAFSHNYAMFAVLRFFTGVGTSGISIITIVLAIEWVDIKNRTLLGVLMSMDWSLGMSILPAVAYLASDWRYLTAAVTSPLIPAMLAWWWLPESARWLMSKGQVDRAHFYLHQCAKINSREQFCADLKPELLLKVVVVENENRKYSYLDLFRTPRMRRLAVLTGTMWFGLACSYYGISLNITGLGMNVYLTQLLYGAIEFPAKALVLFTLNKTGRRNNEVGALVLTALCIFCSMFIPAERWQYRTTLGALGKMFSEASFTVVFLYTTELYPTVMRQNGLGFCSLFARVGVSVSPLILLLEEVWTYLPSCIFTLVALTAGLSASFLPETQNIRLPETIEEVELRRRSFSSTQEKSAQ